METLLGAVFLTCVYSEAGPPRRDMAKSHLFIEPAGRADIARFGLTHYTARLNSLSWVIPLSFFRRDELHSFGQYLGASRTAIFLTLYGTPVAGMVSTVL